MANRKAAGEGLEGQVPGWGRWGLEFSGLERKSGVRYRLGKEKLRSGVSGTPPTAGRDAQAVGRVP